MKQHLRKICTTALLAGLATAAHAVVNRINPDETLIGVQENQYEFLTDAKYWLDADGNPRTESAPLDPTIDYVFDQSGYPIRTSLKASTIFTGKSLTICTGKYLYLYTTLPNVIEFQNEGLTISRTIRYQNGGSVDVSGRVTIKGSVTFEANGTATGRWRGPLLSTDSTDKICLNARYNSDKDCTYTQHTDFDDVSGFHGSILLQTPSKKATVVDANGNPMWLGLSGGSADTPCDATVSLLSGCNFSTANTSSDLTIKNLTIPANVTLVVRNTCTANGDKTYSRAASAIHVTDALTLEGKVKVSFEQGIFKPDGLSGRYVILTAPTTTDLDEDDFELVCDDALYAPLASLTVERADGLAKVVVTTEPIVEMIVSDPQAQTSIKKSTTSAFTNATSWSDGRLPHADAHYFVITNGTTTFAINTPGGCRADTSEWLESSFAGKSLTIGGGCKFLDFVNGTCRVDRLTFLDGSQLAVGQMTYPTLTGSVLRIASGKVDFKCYSGRTLEIWHNLAGEGEISMCGVGGTSSPTGYYQFHGDNSAFKGRMTVTQTENPSKPSQPDSNAQRFYLTAASQLGGALDAFDYRALTIERNSTVHLERDITIAADSNRGVFINNPVPGTNEYGVIFVALNGKYVPSFRLETPLTMNGAIYKKGKGTLTLAGALKFGPDGTSDTPFPASNRVEVTAGTLCVAGAGSVDGLEISLAKDTVLQLETDLTNADLTRYGIKNTKTDTPFTLGTDLDKLPLSVVYPTSIPDAGVRLGLVTVNKNAADDVRAMMPTEFPTHIAGVHAKTIEFEENGLVTFGLELRRNGLLILVK